MIRTTNNFKIHYVDVPISKLPLALNGLKIVQISDIHAGSFTSAKPMTEVLFLIETLQPDLLFVTGDFVNFSHTELPIIMPQLKNLHAKYGVYGCLGNHDHYMSPSDHPSLIDAIQKSGINLLINKNITLNIFNEQLQIAGMDNTSFRMTYGDIHKSLNGLKDYLPTVLLCHDPTNWDKEIRRKTFVDLTVSGHTHGGQIGIEYDELSLSPASLVYKQCAGLYKDKDQYLYVNRGIGTVGPPLRIGIRPEITLITLRSVENFA
jgi:predicted MPP superfamily phosphohydrolase